ncbi:ExbD/TolR family protein [Desulfohalovibrio reitneri]|uniref:ExbD/TolR family protein n=1 Tax=Desulfohalovibrio reitneri TaxID=1307759 RepID=UPI00068E6244|nr:ExbD/TolR family protein [Desulfohalovibrio reitneri]
MPFEDELRPRTASPFLAEINLTPLVDVVFVLLIIFMVTAPLMTQGVEVDLPQTRTVRELPMDSGHLLISVKEDGGIFLDEYEVELGGLEERLRPLAKEDKSVYLRADRDVPYGRVVQVMGEIKAAGVDRLGMVAEREEDDAS